MISYKYVLIYAVFRLFAAISRRKRSKAVGRDDMKSMKKNSIISLALICVFSLLLTVTVGGVKAFAAAPTAAEAKAYYEENKAKVEPIDNGAAFFAKMRDAYVDAGDTGAYDSMVSLVKVAEKATEYKDAYVALKYPLKDRETVIKEVNLALNAVKATSENCKDFKYYEKETKYLERLEEMKTRLDKLKTKQVLFDEAKSAAKTTLEAKRDELLGVSGTPTTTVGALDATAKTAIGDAASEYLAKIDAVTYTTDITDEKDDEKYLKAVVKADDISKAGKDAVIAVPKNDVERTYNDLSDYEAMRDGYVGKKDGETDEQFAARKAALKEKVTAAIKALNESFFPNASKEVLKKYSAEKQRFDAFAKSYNVDDTPYADKDTITSEDGAFTVTAYKKGTETKVAVFPARAVVKALNCGSGAAKTNAENAIRKSDKKLGVAYFMLISVYAGPTEWTAVEKDAAGNAVEYRVSVDLNKYYETYIKDHESLLAMLLKKINFVAKAGEDKAAKISACATDYLKANKTNDNSLCYYYTRSAEGDSAITPLAYELKEGNILMFKTNAFNLFAVSEVNSGSVFTQPLFYIITILALILLIAIIVIILKNVRYSVRFVTGDGSKSATVKARKGESFVMPENPVKAGYVFAGWYEDKELTRRFLDTVIVRRKNIKVYAKWVAALTPGQIETYFNKLRGELLAHGAYADADKIKEGETATLAILASSATEIKMYLAIDAKSAAESGYEVKAVTAKEYAETPTLYVIDGKERFVKALELIARLVKENELVENPMEVTETEDADKHYFALTLTAPAPVKEETVEEEAEEAKEEQTETAIEVTEEQPVKEETVEEEPAAEEVTEEQLAEYYTVIRKAAMGYALAEENDKVTNGMMLVKAYVKDDGVYVYLAGNPEELGLEKAEGLFMGDTPAFIKVTDEATLEKAVAAIDTVMTGYGLEKTGEETELKEAGKNGFGYRLKFND